MPNRENFSRKQYQAQRGVILFRQISVLGQQTQNGRRRIPAGDLLLGHQRREAQRIFADFFGDEHERGSVLKGYMNIENGEVEVEWCV